MCGVQCAMCSWWLGNMGVWWLLCTSHSPCTRRSHDLGLVDLRSRWMVPGIHSLGPVSRCLYVCSISSPIPVMAALPNGEQSCV